ncbi:hypothetical protein ANN_26501 [Periplaneta americana]|uniref:Uncharacterized protein n=1 Tax=Periplaneta americana TaxID=6978 RepID=A0ABQ8RY90_PERAM|nr:hypothetical protein ANN_26501 [Periplaneta americana]
MAGLCEGGNEPSGSLRAIFRWSTYRASKKYNVPFNNLKRFLYASSGPDDVVFPKKGQPVEKEQKLVTYVAGIRSLLILRRQAEYSRRFGELRTRPAEERGREEAARKGEGDVKQLVTEGRNPEKSR